MLGLFLLWSREGEDLTVASNKNRDDETVDLFSRVRQTKEKAGKETYGDNTRHDDGDDTLHHEVGAENGHGGNANTRLGRSITGRMRPSAASALRK